MSTSVAEMKLQLQPLLSDLHRFMAKCVKDKGNTVDDGSSDLMLLLPSSPQKSGLTYFGQRKVEEVVEKDNSTNSKTNNTVTIPMIAKGRGLVMPPQTPFLKNIQQRPECTRNLTIDLLSQVDTKLQDLAESRDETPTSTYDMFEHLSPKNGTPLPAKTQATFKPPPNLEPVAWEKWENEVMMTKPFNADSQLSTGDTTPASRYSSQDMARQKASSGSPLTSSSTPMYIPETMPQTAW